MWQIALLLYAVDKLLSFLFPDYKEHVVLCLIGQQNQAERFLIKSQQNTALAVYNRQYVCQVETSQCAATFDYIFAEPFVPIYNYYCTALAVYQPAAASSNLVLWILLITFLLTWTLTGFVISLLVCKRSKSSNLPQNSEEQSWMKKRSSNMEYTTSNPTTSLQLYRPLSSRSHLQFNIIESFKQATRHKLLLHGANTKWRLRLTSIQEENNSLTTKTLQVYRPVGEVRHQSSTMTILEHAVASVKMVLTTTRCNVSRSCQIISTGPNMSLDVYGRASYVLSQSCTYFNVAVQKVFRTQYCLSPAASSLQIISKQTTLIDLYRQASYRIMQISGIHIFYHDTQLTILVVSCRSCTLVVSCSSLLTIFRPEKALTQFGESGRILLIVTSPMVHIPDYDLPKIARLQSILSSDGEIKQQSYMKTDSTKESMEHLPRYGNTIDPLQVRKLLNLLTPYKQSYILDYDARVFFLVPGMKLPLFSTHHRMFYWNMQITITFFPKIIELKKFCAKIIGNISLMTKGDITPDNDGKDTTEDHVQDKDHHEVENMAKHLDENGQEPGIHEKSTSGATSDVEKECKEEVENEDKDGKNACVEGEGVVEGDKEKDGQNATTPCVEEEGKVEEDSEEKDVKESGNSEIDEVAEQTNKKDDGNDCRQTVTHETDETTQDTEREPRDCETVNSERTIKFSVDHEKLEDNKITLLVTDQDNGTKSQKDIKDENLHEIDKNCQTAKVKDDGNCRQTDTHETDETTQDTEKEPRDCETVNSERTIKFCVDHEKLEDDKITLLVTDQDNGTKSQKDIKDENLHEIDKNSEQIDNFTETTKNEQETVQTIPETPLKKRNRKRKWYIKKKLTSFGKRIMNFFRRKNTVKTEVDNIVTIDHGQFPSWGGEIENKKLGRRLMFINTCPIDNWLVILHHVCLQHPEINKQLAKSPLLKELEMLYRQKEFNKQKYKLMKVNSLHADKAGYVDFYDSEVTSFVKYMDVFFKNSRISTCDSSHCPLPKRVTWHSEPAAWTSTTVSLYDTVLEWIFEESYSRCSQKFKSSPPADAPVYRMENSKTVYCDGNRKTSSREFPQGMPLMIPVDVELLGALGVRLLAKDIPEDMMILDHKYELQAVTLRSENIKHFTCILKLNGDWFYYDGCSNTGKPSPFTGIFPTSYLPGIVLYVRT